MNQIEEYRDALDGLRFSEAGKERIMKSLTEQADQPVKGKRFRPLRPALVAACVCLVLVGTAAAVAGAMGISTRWVEKDTTFEIVDGQAVYHNRPVYVVTDKGMTMFPLSCFSEEALDLYGVDKHGVVNCERFSSWEDLNRFLWADKSTAFLLDMEANPVLSGKKMSCSFYAFDDSMMAANADAYYVLGGIRVNISALIHTEQWAQRNVTKYWNGEPPEDREAGERACQERYGDSALEYRLSEGEELEEETYTASCGIPVTIVRHDLEEEWTSYRAYFLVDGVLYSVYVGADPVGHRPSDPQPVSDSELLDTLKTVLDGFVLE